MATLVTKQLYINEDNVKSYFSTDGGHLNGAAIGVKCLTHKWSNTNTLFIKKMSMANRL